MKGGNEHRFCARCAKHVHDLSAMSRASAEELVNTSQPLCVRVWHDRRGRVITRETAPLRRLRNLLLRFRMPRLERIAAALALPLLLARCGAGNMLRSPDREMLLPPPAPAAETAAAPK
jgi:hypothetical protein